MPSTDGDPLFQLDGQSLPILDFFFVVLDHSYLVLEANGFYQLQFAVDQQDLYTDINSFLFSFPDCVV